MLHLQKKVHKKFAKDNHRKVRHYANTDKHRDASPNICDLKFNVSSEILLVFHNFSNYD